MNYLVIAGSSACIYIFIVAAIRLFGKKELAQLSIIDLVFILLISNAVQNAMVGSDTSLAGGLCAAGTLFIINFVLKYAIYRFPKFSVFVQGSPIMLVYEGAIIKENLMKSRISKDEIEEAAREHGIKLNRRDKFSHFGNRREHQRFIQRLHIKDKKKEKAQERNCLKIPN